MKFLEKRPYAQDLMSNDIQDVLTSILAPPHLETKFHRLVIFCHGSYLTLLLGEIILGISYASTLTSNPTDYEFIYSTAMYGMLSVSGVYQIYWLRLRIKTAELIERLLVLAKELEVNAIEEELQMSKSTRKTMRLVVLGFQMTFIFEVLVVCGQPIMEIRLPPFMRGMEPFSPGCLLAQALHLFAMGPMALTTCQFLTTQIKYMFFLTVGYKIIGRRLRNVEMSDEKQIQSILRLHSAWVELTADIEKWFASWNTMFVVDMMMIALLGTFGVISGITAFEIVLLGPSVGSYILVMCQLGEALEVQGNMVGNHIYEGHWLDGTVELRRLLLLPILRANRPSGMRATLIGQLKLQTFLKCLKEWYRILQFVLNMKSSS